MIINAWTRREFDATATLPLCPAELREELDHNGERLRVVQPLSSYVLSEDAPSQAAPLRRVPHQALPEPQEVPKGTDSTNNVERYAFRDALRPAQIGKQQQCCGRTAVGPVYIGAGWQRGLCTCKGVHCCPVCSAALRARRTLEIEQSIKWWSGQGGGVSMLTLTLRHSYGDDLERLRRGICQCFRELWTGREGRALRAQFSHFVRAFDITWGANGWHPHLHALIYADEKPTEEWLDAVRARWCELVQRWIGLSATPRRDEVGVSLTHKPSRATYLLKLGLELTQITSKEAFGSHLHPWQIAQLAVEEMQQGIHDGKFRALWRSWCKKMKGARHLTWSRGLRDAVELPAEAESDEEADDPVEKKLDPWLVILQGQDWAVLRAYGLTSSELMRLSVRGQPFVVEALRKAGFRESSRRIEQLDANGTMGTVIRMQPTSLDEKIRRLEHDETKRRRPKRLAHPGAKLRPHQSFSRASPKPST